MHLHERYEVCISEPRSFSNEGESNVDDIVLTTSQGEGLTANRRSNSIRVVCVTTSVRVATTATTAQDSKNTV
jgi:hypothetical protein